MGKPFDTSMGGGNRMFPSTLWSMVLKAGKGKSPADRSDLEALVRLYWKPVYCYMKAIRRMGSEDAKDSTQSFFSRILEKGSLENLSPEKGTFRGFLKEAIRNFLVDVHRHDAARLPRKGILLPLEEYRDTEKEGAPEVDPNIIFDREWDNTLLENALKILKTQVKDEKAFTAFRLYCFQGRKKITYADIAREMDLNEASIRKKLARCRNELRDIMKNMIHDYAYDDQHAEEEYLRIVGK